MEVWSPSAAFFGVHTSRQNVEAIPVLPQEAAQGRNEARMPAAWTLAQEATRAGTTCRHSETPGPGGRVFLLRRA
jgi:hypothetical protein